MPPYLTSRFRKLTLRLDPLGLNKDQETYLSADMATSSGTLTVKNIAGFAINQILLIGELGAEDSEIIKTHASSAPSGSTVTLASNTGYAHSRGTKVSIIKYDQVELSRAATVSGSKTTLTTTAGSGIVSLQADTKEQVYDETEYTSGYYFARFKNSIGGTFSGYSDAVPYGGFTSNTVGYAIDYAMRRNSLTGFTEKASYQFCLEEINSCLKQIKGKQVHWPGHQTFNYALGQTSRGSHIFTLPSDIYDANSRKSILGVRVGEGDNLTWKDPLEWENDILADTKFTQVTSAASASNTSLNIDNSYDFDDDGSVNVYVSGTKYTITYTGVTRSTTAGVLTGVPASGTGAITVTIPADTYVWQDEEEGQPRYFTIRNGSLEIWPLPDSSYDNMNVMIDYETTASEVDSDADTLDTDRADMVKNWLVWAIRSAIKRDGIRNLNDADYLLYKESLNDAIRTKRSVVRHKHTPRINSITY